MKLCAIICEFNPFHNGHKYLIDKSLEQSGCDAVLCIMGGNFTQRGEPAICDKNVRALMAISGGASAVVQIPSYFCSANAEVFAQAAVKIATSFKNVTHISFGSECGDIRSITELATFLNNEPDFYKERIQKNLQDGFSLGRAKTHALQECIDTGLVHFSRPEVVKILLDSPNNVLGVEYLRAIYKTGRKDIVPITVKRIDELSSSTEKELIDLNISSASAIRESMYRSKRISNIKKFMPSQSFSHFAKSVKSVGIPDMEIWGNLALYRLRTATPSDLALNYDVVEGIENKLINTARENIDYPSFVDACSSRRFTKSRIKRIVTASLLNLRSEYVKHIYEIDKLPYIKLLASKSDENLLAAISECNSILVTRKQEALLAEKDPYAKILMFAEDKATQTYALLIDLTKDQQKDLFVSDIYQKTIFVK